MLHLSSSENKEILKKLIFWSPLHFLGSFEALQLKDMKGHGSGSKRKDTALYVNEDKHLR